MPETPKPQTAGGTTSAGHRQLEDAQDRSRGVALAGAVAAGLGDCQAEIAVAPPFTAIAPVADALRGSPIRLAAQDVFHEPEGAFTGAISAPMLAAAGCSLTLVGHSERRHVFGDRDDDVRKKARAVLDAGMRPSCASEKRSRNGTPGTRGVSFARNWQQASTDFRTPAWRGC